MKGYRTLALAVVTALTGSLEAADALPWGTDVTGVIMAVLGAVAFVLRFYTDTPVRKGGA